MESLNTTVTVTWFTDQGLAGYVPTVRYGTSTGSYTKSTTGTSPHTYPGATVDISDAELTGLSPDTTYYYICGDTTHGFSEEKSFRTPPENGGFTFCAFGDSREGLYAGRSYLLLIRVYAGDLDSFQFTGPVTVSMKSGSVTPTWARRVVNN